MDKILLDTQILIWLAEAPDKLSVSALEVLNTGNQLFISHVSVWEMVIKIKIGKLSIEFSLQDFIEKAQQKHNLSALSILISHIYKTLELPLHHKDPFDRLLIAQSLSQSMPIISSDALFDPYNVTRIW